jgi:hypothetical protein
MKLGQAKPMCEELFDWWGLAGGLSTEENLARKNAAGSKYNGPALYPAMDPDSHQDVEDDEVELSNLTDEEEESDSYPDRQDSLAHLRQKTLKYVDTFDMNDIFLGPGQLNNFTSETYSDVLGLPVTSVWDTQKAKKRPPFAVTLYTTSDMLPAHPKALFKCLNWGMIADEAWTLDVVTNMPNLSSAYEYHRAAWRSRTTGRTRQRRSCIQMLLQKIVPPHLPAELSEVIENLLVPPPIPSYSSPCRRPFKHLFLYIDSKALRSGPLLVYSEPEVPKHTSAGHGALRLHCLRLWNRVANEISNLESLLVFVHAWTH